jgi:tRNA (guanosine-2'-O-)-methyltransferase
MALLSGGRRGRSIETISERRRDKFEAALSRRQPDLAVVMENIWDPHNVGAILRTADAVGIPEVHLLYHRESFPDLKRIGKQSSASAKKWLDFRRHDNPTDCIHFLREMGFTIYASRLDRDAMSLYDIDATKPSAFVLGNESRGVSEEITALADCVYMIPMIGMVQSLNVSVAAAVTLYEALRQRLAAGMCDSARFSEEELRDRLASWSKR